MDMSADEARRITIVVNRIAVFSSFNEVYSWMELGLSSSGHLSSLVCVPPRYLRTRPGYYLGVCACVIVGLIPNVDDEMGGRLSSVSTLDREHSCETN